MAEIPLTAGITVIIKDAKGEQIIIQRVQGPAGSAPGTPIAAAGSIIIALPDAQGQALRLAPVVSCEGGVMGYRIALVSDFIPGPIPS